MAQTIPSHGQTAEIWQAAQREVQVLATATMPTDCVPKRLWAIRPTLTIGTAVSLP